MALCTHCERETGTIYSCTACHRPICQWCQNWRCTWIDDIAAVTAANMRATASLINKANKKDEWYSLIAKQVTHHDRYSDEAFEARMLEIAKLAIAAIESQKRCKHAK